MIKEQTLGVTEEQKDQALQALEDHKDKSPEFVLGVLTQGIEGEDGTFLDGVGIPPEIAQVLVYTNYYPYESSEDFDKKTSIYQEILSNYSGSDIAFARFILNRMYEYITRIRQELDDAENTPKH